ncbi:unnamed protein product [Didymodactylos carnosus]|uniref:Uncharacterized protein n=1 Tax=Didymodactylos carnosus TaxID=1234261 RepID=A0A8S2DXP9_9BILA|nr:unnamed protein product [Didymodactylos carnosus]CAF3803630.1 unnamed protein product [Didymodactylos carnosus]
MGQSQSSKFDKYFSLICTDNVDELRKQLNSLTNEQANLICNLHDIDKGTGTTLLMYAAFYGNALICKLLIDNGASKVKLDCSKRNVLYYSIAGQSYNVAKYLMDTCDANTKQTFINNIDQNNETALHEAVKTQNLHCIDLLLINHIDVNVLNKGGISALHIAVDLGKVDIVRLLLKHKANPNTKDSSNWTPVHVASAHNDLNILRLLLSRGGKVNITDQYGQTPLQWARETKSKDVLHYLKKIGAKEYTSSISLSTGATTPSIPSITTEHHPHSPTHHHPHRRGKKLSKTKATSNDDEQMAECMTQSPSTGVQHNALKGRLNQYKSNKMQTSIGEEMDIEQ